MSENIVGSAAVAVTAGVLVAGYVYWRRRRMPTEWRQIATLENIYMSPLKSGFFAEQNEVVCDVTGLTGINRRFRDRSFMIVNTSGRFITGRTHPLLTQVKCDVNEEEVTFSFVLNEEIRPLTIKFSELEAQKPSKVKFGWDNDKRWVQVIDCGDQAASWIQSCIISPDHHNDQSGVGTSLRIVYLVDDTLCDDRGRLFDETSYMLLSQKSLEDLNTRLNVPVTMRQFRPNFVVSGSSKPYEEDEWEWIRIGDVVFRYIKPCLSLPFNQVVRKWILAWWLFYRCSFTTVDAETGVKDKDKTQEPLKTLKSYRQIQDADLRRKLGQSPVFGAHYGLRSPPGLVIRKGDPVYVNVN